MFGRQLRLVTVIIKVTQNSLESNRGPDPYLWDKLVVVRIRTRRLS